MSPTAPLRLLQRYRVDRAAGGTADGSTQLVVVVLKAQDTPEIAYVFSKADAMIVGTQMQLAAQDAQDVANG